MVQGQQNLDPVLYERCSFPISCCKAEKTTDLYATTNNIRQKLSFLSRLARKRTEIPIYSLRSSHIAALMVSSSIFCRLSSFHSHLANKLTIAWANTFNHTIQTMVAFIARHPCPSFCLVKSQTQMKNIRATMHRDQHKVLVTCDSGLLEQMSCACCSSAAQSRVSSSSNMDVIHMYESLAASPSIYNGEYCFDRPFTSWVTHHIKGFDIPLLSLNCSQQLMRICLDDRFISVAWKEQHGLYVLAHFWYLRFFASESCTAPVRTSLFSLLSHGAAIIEFVFFSFPIPLISEWPA